MGVKKTVKKPASINKGSNANYPAVLRSGIIINELYKRPHGIARETLKKMLSVSDDTMRRYKREHLPEVMVNGKELVEYIQTDSGEVWRIKENFTFKEKNVRDMLSLYMAASVMRFLKGTSARGRVKSLGETVKGILPSQHREMLKDFDRKIYFHPFGPKSYSEQSEIIETILSSLMHNERIQVTRSFGGKGEKTFECEPLTLLMYKNGLYLVARSVRSSSGRINTNKLEDIKRVERVEHIFSYPKDYDPKEFFKSSFGIMVGDEKTKVKVFFDDLVAYNAKSRQWHPSQKVKKVKGGIEISFTLEGTRELIPWVLGYGKHARILSPQSIIDEIKDVVDEMKSNYE